jgi:hypothetical protein
MPVPVGPGSWNSASTAAAAAARGSATRQARRLFRTADSAPDGSSTTPGPTSGASSVIPAPAGGPTPPVLAQAGSASIATPPAISASASDRAVCASRIRWPSSAHAAHWRTWVASSDGPSPSSSSTSASRSRSRASSQRFTTGLPRWKAARPGSGTGCADARETHHLASLGRGHSLQIHEIHDRPLLIAQLFKKRPHQVRQLRGFAASWAPPLPFLHRILRTGGLESLQGTVSRLRPPIQLAGHVPHDRVQPAVERPGAAQGADRGVRLDERALNDVFGVVRIAGPDQGPPAEGRQRVPGQAVEGVRVTCLSSLDPVPYRRCIRSRALRVDRVSSLGRVVEEMDRRLRAFTPRPGRASLRASPGREGGARRQPTTERSGPRRPARPLRSTEIPANGIVRLASTGRVNICCLRRHRPPRVEDGR